MSVIDDYLKSATPSQRVELERVREIVKRAVPEAEETVSYGIPTMTYRGKYLIYFAAYKHHMSIFGGLGAVEDKLEGFTLSHKGTLQFTEDKPVPESVIKEIVLTRLAELSRTSGRSQSSAGSDVHGRS